MPDEVVGEVTIGSPGSNDPPTNGDDDMAAGDPNLGLWQERLYAGVEKYDTDAKFFENALKSAHLEGKMSAREMTFAKGGGLPTVMPLPSGQTTHIPSIPTS